MKLFLAAPDSGLPSALTALGAHVSAMHFFMNEVLAAPASGLPSLLMALLSQVSCAIAEPAAKVAIIAAKNTFLIIFALQMSQLFVYPPKRRKLTASFATDQESRHTDLHRWRTIEPGGADRIGSRLSPGLVEMVDRGGARMISDR
jgi:hypothetical protein